MRVGTMFLGEVEAMDNESIQTKFFVLGVPLAPLESFYATGQSASGISGIPIELHGPSVLAGYLRIPTFVGALLTGIFAWIEWRSYDPQWTLAGICAVSTLAWVGSTFLLGRLSETEQRRRRILKRATGIGIPPELLGAGTRQELQDALVKRWDSLGLGDWRERLQSGNATAAELGFLYAIARYDHDHDLAKLAALAMGEPI